MALEDGGNIIRVVGDGADDIELRIAVIAGSGRVLAQQIP